MTLPPKPSGAEEEPGLPFYKRESSNNRVEAWAEALFDSDRTKSSSYLSPHRCHISGQQYLDAAQISVAVKSAIRDLGDAKAYLERIEKGIESKPQHLTVECIAEMASLTHTSTMSSLVANFKIFTELMQATCTQESDMSQLQTMTFELFSNICRTVSDAFQKLQDHNAEALDEGKLVPNLNEARFFRSWPEGCSPPPNGYEQEGEDRQPAAPPPTTQEDEVPHVDLTAEVHTRLASKKRASATTHSTGGRKRKRDAVDSAASIDSAAERMELDGNINGNEPSDPDPKRQKFDPSVDPRIEIRYGFLKSMAELFDRVQQDGMYGMKRDIWLDKMDSYMAKVGDSCVRRHRELDEEKAKLEEMHRNCRRAFEGMELPPKREKRKVEEDGVVRGASLGRGEGDIDGGRGKRRRL